VFLKQFGFSDFPNVFGTSVSLPSLVACTSTFVLSLKFLLL